MNDSQLKKLVDSYQPNDEVRQMMQRINLLATVGPSASGKTTIMNKLVQESKHVHFVLDETSRAPRKNEIQAVDFLFRSRENILEDLKRGDLVQVALGPNGDLYCTRPTSYPHLGIGIIALVPAAVKEFRKLPIGSLKTAFIVPKSFKAWMGWFEKQAQDSGWSEQQRNGRLAEAKLSHEFAIHDKEINFVLNDDINKATRRLLQICEGKAPSDEAKARIVAKNNYQELVATL